MITHKRSGLLISKFSLRKFFRQLINYVGSDSRKSCFKRNHDIVETLPSFFWLFITSSGHGKNSLQKSRQHFWIFVFLYIKIEIRSWNFFHAPDLVYNQYFPVTTTTWLSIKVIMKSLSSFFTYLLGSQFVQFFIDIYNYFDSL